ncbi:2Fe-2S iron-sulfur cluster-binding protein [Brenneria tiliae]|uniref:succinate dehydrogenase n=1 Tax=Brenneria tiliae TaxID=2914984 RepID=A0ABT0MPE1_9GAMM|nr:2Fe-2S iron-sulfur cluster-binding protein [Brenneria tiliae]MCL2891661.1 2Fe-2S iron-sulfur cluster-binding protein [Brenneria tiliae]MCL2898737.1 2Fe-2S iron-sulfur cluster-binding protein [Brenneria tiliae]MCL2903326.1 2Fe-2S iron-sulfur cluster-binding protein [Brenneria tiliae]
MSDKPNLRTDNDAGGHAALRIRRGVGAQADRYQTFTVPLAEVTTLLDGLEWIRRHADDSLAFRYSCINAKACKQCMMRLDGKVVYACVTHLRADAEHRVEPMANKPRLRDLVVENGPNGERLEEPSPTGTHRAERINDKRAAPDNKME